MAIARFLDRLCLALRASGLWLRYATLQNLITSLPWIAPGWRAQILPSGNLDLNLPYSHISPFLPPSVCRSFVRSPAPVRSHFGFSPVSPFPWQFPVDRQLCKLPQLLHPHVHQRSRVKSCTHTNSKLSKSTIHNILKKNLRWKPFRYTKTQVLTADHRRQRKAFCRWILEQPENFPDNVLWSDEKWWCLQQGPNRQNDREAI